MTSLIEVHSFASERAELVRFCARYTGNPDIAEDLTQQTLLRAWQHGDTLRDPTARRAWLFSIARNVCLTWGRTEGRRRIEQSDRTAGGVLPTVDAVTDAFDVEIELERDELAALLDRALASLPADSREVLVRRYIEGLPQAELAAQLGISEGAVEARLQRGKLKLKRLLTTDLSEEAIAFGLIEPSSARWEVTRIWCPICGSGRLEGKLDAGAGELLLSCPRCSPTGTYHFRSYLGTQFHGLKTYRPAMSRVLNHVHQTFRVEGATGIRCPVCHDRLTIERGVAPFYPSPDGSEQVFVRCFRCTWADLETWQSLAWSVPEVHRFWREHPRTRLQPARFLEVNGAPAVALTLESITNSDRIETVLHRDSTAILSVAGQIPGER